VNPQLQSGLWESTTRKEFRDEIEDNDNGGARGPENEESRERLQALLSQSIQLDIRRPNKRRRLVATSLQDAKVSNAGEASIIL
jgi:endonuclease YncB( thermonuclease family)